MTKVDVVESSILLGLDSCATMWSGNFVLNSVTNDANEAVQPMEKTVTFGNAWRSQGSCQGS